MIPRSLPLALALLFLTAPSADAALSDRYLPTADGVTFSEKKGVTYAHLPAKLYRKVAGRRAFVACGGVVVPSTGGPPVSGGYGGFEPRLPRKRTAIALRSGGTERLDVCTLATRREKTDRGRCIPNGTDDPRCVRVILPLTDLGRTYLDARGRAIDLWLVKDVLPVYMGETAVVDQLRNFLGPDIVGLAAPDDPVPPGKVGVFVQGENYALATLLADGRRQFVRFDNPVYSTNVHEFIRGEDEEHTIFSVFL